MVAGEDFCGSGGRTVMGTRGPRPSFPSTEAIKSVPAVLINSWVFVVLGLREWKCVAAKGSFGARLPIFLARYFPPPGPPAQYLPPEKHSTNHTIESNQKGSRPFDVAVGGPLT